MSHSLFMSNVSCAERTESVEEYIENKDPIKYR